MWHDLVRLAFVWSCLTVKHILMKTDLDYKIVCSRVYPNREPVEIWVRHVRRSHQLNKKPANSGFEEWGGRKKRYNRIISSGFESRANRGNVNRQKSLWSFAQKRLQEEIRPSEAEEQDFSIRDASDFKVKNHENKHEQSLSERTDSLYSKVTKDRLRGIRLSMVPNLIPNAKPNGKKLFLSKTKDAKTFSAIRSDDENSEFDGQDNFFNEVDDLFRKRDFNPWAGKRSGDSFSPWGGKRSTKSLAKPFSVSELKRSFSPWAGKRNNGGGGQYLGRKQGAVEGGGNHRTDRDLENFHDAPETLQFDKRAFNAWGGKRGFDPWTKEVFNDEFPGKSPEKIGLEKGRIDNGHVNSRGSIYNNSDESNGNIPDPGFPARVFPEDELSNQMSHSSSTNDAEAKSYWTHKEQSVI